MPDESVPSGEVDFVRSADTGIPGKFVPVDFAETRAEAVAFSEQQVVQGDEVLEKLSRADENALTDQAGELAHEVPKGLEVSKLGVAY